MRRVVVRSHLRELILTFLRGAGFTGEGSLFGVGLRSEHIEIFHSGLGAVSESGVLPNFLEIHAENFLDLGCPRTRALLKIREDYPISCHAVGLSLGSAGGVDRGHLMKVKALVDELDPILFSDHVSWSVGGGYYMNDLLPLPLTMESLECLTGNIGMVQESLGRAILVENPSSYVSFGSDELSEGEFMSRIASMSGCGILLDLNNVYISSLNCGFSVSDYLSCISDSSIGEVHLAGHVVEEREGRAYHIDTHSRAVCAEVWSIYEEFVGNFSEKAVLVEWDSQLPELSVLLGECDKARGKARDIGWH